MGGRCLQLSANNFRCAGGLGEGQCRRLREADPFRSACAPPSAIGLTSPKLISYACANIGWPGDASGAPEKRQFHAHLLPPPTAIPVALPTQGRGPRRASGVP